MEDLMVVGGVEDWEDVEGLVLVDGATDNIAVANRSKQVRLTVADFGTWTRKGLYAVGVVEKGFEVGYDRGVPIKWKMSVCVKEDITSVTISKDPDQNLSVYRIRTSIHVGVDCHSLSGMLDILPLADKEEVIGFEYWNCFGTRQILKEMEKTRAESFVMVLNMTVFEEVSNYYGSNPDLATALYLALETGIGTDAEILAYDPEENRPNVPRMKPIKFHWEVILIRTGHFPPLTQVAQRQFVITDMTYQGVKSLLHFIYTGQINDDWMKLKIAKELLHFSTHYGGFPQIKDFFDSNLVYLVTSDNVVELISLCNAHGLDKAKQNIIGFEMEKFI